MMRFLPSIRVLASAIFCFSASTSPTSTDDDTKKCKLYLAKSTIPNAGLGVFTSINLFPNDSIGYGDPAIPIVDMDFHNGGSSSAEDYHWLLDDYNWKASAAGYFMEAEAEKTSAHVSGMGAMPNCHMRLKNIVESGNEYDTAGVTRGDPGIGAFTGYHNRKTFAIKPIEAGQELFVDYGKQWFLTRENYMGLVPLVESYPIATKFLDHFRLKDFLERLMFSRESEELMSDLWELIVRFPYKSRPQSALPKNLNAAKKAIERGIYQTELWQSTLSLDELERDGKCLDNIRPGNSTISGAGRGAFAARFLPKGSLVAPAPLLHVPDRDILNMYADKIDPFTQEEYRDFSKLTGRQLLLNYCFGHRSSSLLLCPYGFQTAFINHNGISPNAKVIWSTDSMYHNSSFLEQPVKHFDNVWRPVLGFDYVALRDIQEGEEITINYGAHWEEAWTAHLQSWVPPIGYEKFVPPQVLNADRTSPLRTFDEDETMYTDHIDLYCEFSNISVKKQKSEWDEDEFNTNDHKVYRILERTKNHEEGEPDYYLYTLDLLVEIDGNAEKFMLYTVTNVPREAISFYYKRYHSDMFVRGAFRHEMMIPDDIFPSAWKNIDLS
eukprot:CCRYP_020446-RA/>CCRYP_020446-RA protein AED:0.34 eAED:0.34 QI:116/1/1/1/1/1/3/218/607